MPTLVLAPARQLLTGGQPGQEQTVEGQLAWAANEAGWTVVRPAPTDPPPADPELALYVTTDVALATARAFELALLEPPFDLLARLPDRLRLRPIEAARFVDLTRLRGPTFVKPADPLDKWFDAGVYRDVRDIRTKGQNRPDAPVLVAGVVSWAAELRYWVLEGKVVAGSPYLSLGRPNWSPGCAGGVPKAGLRTAEAAVAALGNHLPPAVVIDVGAVEERGWAVVEFNPVWCAGVLGADPAAVLPALRRATRRKAELTDADRRWAFRW
ncbi:ATP-grasp domain-containing protein [bacterium]|nr:ATP-grasp domain-containing protein [bacterium]